MKKIFLQPIYLLLFLVIVSFFTSACSSKNESDLGITEEVLQNEWKPIIRQELINFYNTHYMASLSNPEQMLAMLNKINALEITEISLRERGAKTASWSFSNQKRASYIHIAYTMGDATPPDGITQRDLKVIISGINRIDRVEGL